MGLKRVTGLWVKSNSETKQRFLSISLGLGGVKLVLALTGKGEWTPIIVCDEFDATIGKPIMERKSASGRVYMLLDLGVLGRYVAFRNVDKRSENSPDWTLNREIADDVGDAYEPANAGSEFSGSGFSDAPEAADKIAF